MPLSLPHHPARPVTPAPYRRASPDVQTLMCIPAKSIVFQGPCSTLACPVQGPQLLPLPCTGVASACSPRLAYGEYPIPGIMQCTWVQMSFQAQGPPFPVIIPGMVLPYLMGWTMHRVVLIFPQIPVRYLFIPVLLF